MAIYKMDSTQFTSVPEKSYGDLGIRERDDLQRLLRSQIDVIAPDTLVIGEEFCQWEDSQRRIDLLGIDRAANLVVIELKVAPDGGHMELQAIRYAAMVAAMTFDTAVDVLAEHMERMGKEGDARQQLLSFLEWQEPDEDAFAQDVRMLLVSPDFSKEITTAVMWLNERGLDIRCVRMKPYSDDGRVLVDVQQVIPLPEAEEYQIRLRRKAERERSDRRTKSDLEKLLHRFWTMHLNKANERTDLHSRISPQGAHWITTGAGSVGGLGLLYGLGRQHPRVALTIHTGDVDRNKALFDKIHSRREEVEGRFGDSLSWERKEDKVESQVRFELTDIQWSRDEADWPRIQEAMIEAMIRFEEALRPVLDDLKDA